MFQRIPTSETHNCTSNASIQFLAKPIYKTMLYVPNEIDSSQAVAQFNKTFACQKKLWVFPITTDLPMLLKPILAVALPDAW